MATAQAGTSGKSQKSTITVLEATSSFDLEDQHLVGQVMISLNSVTSLTVTVPPGLVGKEPVTFVNEGTGRWDFVGGAGVTLKSKLGANRMTAQFSAVSIVPDPRQTDGYWLIGDLT